MATSTTPPASSPTPTAPTVDTQNFQNNAFSNLTPLLTLFGDEITKQFLSTSMGWADDILLSLAPIGIMTVIICAIRIGGTRLLKALIGRARESPDDGEKEILSSTSRNVREIWDGTQIVRQTGPSITKTIMFDSTWTPQQRSQSPLSEYLSTLGDTFSISNIGRDFTRAARLKGYAPSLVLNTSTAIPKQSQVTVYMIVGIGVQAGVIVLNGLVVYRWEWPRAGHAVASYGFPLWLVGTLSITLGVALCARVIESSTDEYNSDDFRKFGGDPVTPSVRFWWLQEKIPALNLPAFAIQGKAEMPFKMSVRKSPDIFIRFITVFGTIFTLIGFVCQNIATRELHWSAGVLQLGATIILIGLRALLRRHVGDLPDPPPVTLLDGQEASQLISHMEGILLGILSESKLYGVVNRDIPTNALLSSQSSEDSNSVYDSRGQLPYTKFVLDKDSFYVPKIDRVMAAYGPVPNYLPNLDCNILNQKAKPLGHSIQYIRRVVLGIQDNVDLIWSPDLVVKDIAKSPNSDFLPRAIISNLLLSSSPGPNLEAKITAILDSSELYWKSRYKGIGGRDVYFDWMLGSWTNIEDAQNLQKRFWPWIEGSSSIREIFTENDHFAQNVYRRRNEIHDNKTIKLFRRRGRAGPILVTNDPDKIDIHKWSHRELFNVRESMLHFTRSDDTENTERWELHVEMNYLDCTQNF